MRAQFKLLTTLLVDVRRTQHGPTLTARGKRDRPANRCTCLLSRPNDISRGLIHDPMIERLQSNPNPVGHYFTRYSMIAVTTPAPTVRPPSRIANRSSFSIAIGVIELDLQLTLSPGMHHLGRPESGSEPVTSVVRK